jgi:hypothetical protein
MTKISFTIFILFLQLVSGAATTSEDRSAQRTCLRSLGDVREAYLSHQHYSLGLPAHHNTIFRFYPETAKTFTIAAFLYTVRTADNVTHTSSGCCDPENTTVDCMAILRFRTHLFRELYPPILVMYAFPFDPKAIVKGMNGEKNKYLSYIHKYGISKYCWNLPAFCQSEMFDSRETILKEFTKEVSWGGELGR